MWGNELGSVVFRITPHGEDEGAAGETGGGKMLFRTSYKTSEHFARMVVVDKSTGELVAFGKVVDA